jgi:hypothetical protein
MAIAKPQIFTNIIISNAGGTSSAATYTINPVDRRSILAESQTELVDAGDTILNMFNHTIEFVTYDDAITSDARVQYNSTIPGTAARVVFTGASGAHTLTIDNVKPVLEPVFDGDRVGYKCMFTKTATTNIIAISG